MPAFTIWFPNNKPNGFAPREKPAHPTHPPRGPGRACIIKYCCPQQDTNYRIPPHHRNPPHTTGGAGTAGGGRVTVVIAWGKRPVPFRTRKLRPTAPMVLHSRGCGRVGHRRTTPTRVEAPTHQCWGLPNFNNQPPHARIRPPQPPPPPRQGQPAGPAGSGLCGPRPGCRPRAPQWPQRPPASWPA
jgi:hypothetical protein